jgi:ATP-dependent RNA helicase DeaD
MSDTPSSDTSPGPGSSPAPESPLPPTPESGNPFLALGLELRLVDALTHLGYEEPTPIQSEGIPPLLEGRDLVGQAATGTGKSAAFALPLIQRLVSGGAGRHQPSVLILVPTRELAMQLSEAVYRYGRALGVTVLPIYGGQSFSQQLKVLKRGVDVVVATPGRALDHVGRGTLRLDRISAVVLDEADEMLDMGFADDLEAILAATPEERQTVLFSATMPPRIHEIARRHLRDPVEVRIAGPRDSDGEVPQVREVVYFVARAHKVAALGRVLDVEDPEAAIIFCRTRTEVDELTETLNAHGHRAEALHGGMTQEQRDRVMKKLRGGTADLLTATDVAARGLDISRLTHVINFDVPNAAEAYVHRIGRVGRAGREGVAITLAEPREQGFVRNIERLTHRSLQVARLPTVADLRDRRLEATRSLLEETISGGDLDRFRSLVEALAEEFDPMDIAAAAIQLAQVASGQDVQEAEDIPEVSLSRSRPGGGDRTPRPGARKGAPPRGNLESIFIGVGRDTGVRPQDLVGAITGEAGVSGDQIGKIQIGERFTLVEVARDVADDVIAALRSAKIKGKRVTVRRDRGRP